MRAIKKLIRKLLPAPMDNALRRAVHARRLKRAPTRTVDLAPLPKATEISFPDMLGGDGVANGWEQARSLIDEIFENVKGSHAIGHGSRRAIYYLIRHFQPRAVLEIGTNVGASTLHILMAMKAYRHEGDLPRLVTVDLWDVNDPAASEWKRYPGSGTPRETLARLNCADMVEFSVALSTDYLDGRVAEFDFIFMDHAPSADIAYQDIALAIKALRPGGQLLLHSCFPDGKPLRTGERVNPGFYLAVRRLRHEGARLVALPPGPLPWPTDPGGSNHLTSLALLGRE